MAASAKIIDLRNLLAERFPHPSCTTARCLITGLSFLDESIGGGLPRGAITELISPAAEGARNERGKRIAHSRPRPLRVSRQLFPGAD